MKNSTHMSFDSPEGAVVSEGLKMTGDLAFGKPGVMNGRIKGRVFADDKIIIGKKGSVNGGVMCGSCEIHGKTKGNIQSQGMVLVTGDAQGDIAAQGIEIRPGARFKGALCVGGQDTQWNALWKNVKVWGHRIIRKAKN